MTTLAQLHWYGWLTFGVCLYFTNCALALFIERLRNYNLDEVTSTFQIIMWAASTTMLLWQLT